MDESPDEAAARHINNYLYRLAGMSRALLRDDQKAAELDVPFGSGTYLTVGDLKAATAALERS